MRRALSLLLVSGLALSPAFLFASNHTLGDYDYRMGITVVNQSGSAFSDTPIAVTWQPSNLVSDGFLQADAEDLRPADADNVAMEATAQDLGSDSSVLWLMVDSQADNSTANYYLHMGNSTATRDQGFLFDGTTDTVTAADHADLDITNNLTLEATTTLAVIPSSLAYIAYKDGSYGLGVRSGNEVVGRIWGATTQATLLPSAPGDFRNMPGQVGCASNAHWDCVDSDDGLTSYVHGNDVAATNQDAYNAQDFSPTDASITQVDMDCEPVNMSGGATSQVGVRLGGTTGTLQACSPGRTNFSRPGGGDWTPPDLDSVQIIVEVTDTVNGSNAGVSYARIIVNYIEPIEVTHTPIVVDTEYVFRLTYDQANLRLYVDDTEEDTVAETDAINTNSEDFLVGSGITGVIDRVRIGTISVSSPTYVLDHAFEPGDLAQTQGGDPGNSWTWTGTVEDISTGGVDHDGAYSLTRDMSGITVWTTGLEIKALPADVVFESDIKNVLGSTAVDPTGTEASANFPFRSFFDAGVANTNATALAGWFLLLSVIGIAVALGVYGRTKNEFMAIAPVVGVYLIGWKLGMGIGLWVPILAALVGLGVAGGVRKFAQG